MSEARNVPPSRDPVIPDKLYFRIGEVARLLGVETHTLRFWETEFPQLKVGKGGTGQRLYRRRDVELVFEIKHLLYEHGYTIPGARQFLQTRQRRKEPAASSASAPQREPEKDSSSEPNLERIRAGLRDLSDLLTGPAAQERPAGNAPMRDRNRPRPESPQRGLHLAPRSAAKSAVPRTTLGLFDPESE
ncbi:MerR family transcriptional regulator [Terriglobus sp.]|uniref:MerR family transcriptional regulator n=1 Tax=Terriglobus sp. TaxID=1889013 RepID=UPI003B00BE3C